MSQKLKLSLLILITLATIFYVGVRTIRFTGGKDGRSFYYGSRLLLSGKNPYDDHVIVKAWKDQGSPSGYKPGLPDAPFIVPPIAAFLFVPVTLFHSAAAGITFIRIYSFLCGLVSVALLLKIRGKFWSKEVCLLFVLYALLLPPFLRSLAFAQSTLIVCACLAACLYLLSRHKNVWAGIFLGLALAKFTLTLPFLIILLYRRSWTTSLVASVTFAAGCLLFFAPIGIRQGIHDYTSDLLSTSDSHGANSPYDLTLINLQHLVLYVFGANPTAAKCIMAALTLIILSALGYLYRPQYLFEFRKWSRSVQTYPFSHPLDIPVAVMAALTLFYHRYYDLATLIFVAWGLIEYGLRWPERGTLLYKIDIALLFVLSFLGSEDFPFRLLDPVLARFGLPSMFYLNCFLTLFLFVGLLCLFIADKIIYRDNKNSIDIRVPDLTKI